MTGSTDIETGEIHLSASRRRGTINASLSACASFGLAALVAVIVLEQPHLPSGTAGYVLAAALVAGFTALGYRATRAALRARRSGVTINPDGIVLHNPTNDTWPAQTRTSWAGSHSTTAGPTTSRARASAEPCGNALGARKKYRCACDSLTSYSR
jgi:hypothetical protein